MVRGINEDVGVMQQQTKKEGTVKTIRYEWIRLSLYSFVYADIRRENILLGKNISFVIFLRYKTYGKYQYTLNIIIKGYFPNKCFIELISVLLVLT